MVIRGIVPLGHSNPMSLTYSKLPFGVPRYTTFPSASSMSASNAKNTTELGWCMLVMIVFPSSRARSWSILMRATADVLSSPDVGSLRNTIAGSVSGSLPMFTLFFSPPDIMFISVSAHLDNRSRHIVRSTLSTFLPCAHPVVHLDAIVFGCSGGQRRSNAAAAVTTTTPLTAANRINNQQMT